jgi:hypothetical protein
VETFIVRLWTPSPERADEVVAPELHGSLEHVGSKLSDAFRTSDELLELLRAALEPRDDASPRP